MKVNNLFKEWFFILVIISHSFFADEKMDPELYALNMAKLVSREAGIPLAKNDALLYLKEIMDMRDCIDELKPTGWKRFLSCGIELPSHKRK